MEFQTAIARGSDWQGVARSLLVQLPNMQQSNVAFLYVADALAKDTRSLFTFLRRTSHIRHWIGGSNLAAFTNHGFLHGEAGAVMMVGHMPPGTIHHPDPAIDTLRQLAAPVGIIHGDPRLHRWDEQLAALSRLPTYWMGGMLLNRDGHHAFNGDQMDTAPITLTCFNSRLSIATALFQGCRPIGQTHWVTGTDGNRITMLDHRAAVDVFADTMAALIKNLKKPLLQESDFHIALLPAASDDSGHYAVRGIAKLMAENKSIALASPVAVGQKIQFVQRDRDFAEAHMADGLEKLQARIRQQKRKVVAGHYVSCMTRLPGLLGDDVDGEMAMLRHVLGPVPIIGYYGIGEIARGELHNFAGALTLWLE